LRKVIISPRFFAVFLLVLSCRSARAEVNLALHKNYTLTPVPNYALCTDKSDENQLTDGKTFGSWWVKKTTVGWKLASSGIEVVIDLKQAASIDQVKVYSVGGGYSNVEFPDFIAVLVSGDGEKYRFAGLISSKDLAGRRSKYQRIPHTFVIDNINAQGRFVKVVVRPRGYYFFLDEIEVIGSKDKLKRQTERGDNLFVSGDSERLLRTIEDYLQVRENVTEVVKVLPNIQNRFSPDFFKKVSTELGALRDKVPLPINKMYSQSELLALGKRVGAIRARIYRQVYNSEFACFVADPMKMLLERDMQVVDVSKRRSIDVRLWQREYESAAVNIINCSQEPLDIVVSLSPLVGPTGTNLEASKIVTLRRAIFVRALNLGLIADALVLQPEEPFQLKPGGVAQIWFTVFNPVLPAGDYKGVFAVAASCGSKKFPVKSLQLNITVDKITFPEDIALNTCTWDIYPWYNGATEHIMDVVAEDLRTHYVNVSVIHPYLVPFLKTQFNASYFSKFEKHLQNNDFCRMYLLYFAWRGKRKQEGRFGQWMSSTWKREFSAWLRKLVAVLKERGVGYERFALYPYDETLGDEFYRVAKLIKQVNPKIKIFANNFGRGPSDFMRFKDLIDIWCPHRVHCTAHPEWLGTIKSFGKEVWTYAGEARPPAKTFPPYGYYRLMAWDAFHRGQTGIGFWTYIDRKEHAWDDVSTPIGYYTVIYGANKSPVDTHGEKIVPSRRWEAWREGIEDYEYLAQLQKAIDQTSRFDSRAAAKAQAILNSQVARVVNNRSDTEAVYSARQIITETLLRLRALTPITSH